MRIAFIFAGLLFATRAGLVILLMRRDIGDSLGQEAVL